MPEGHSEQVIVPVDAANIPAPHTEQSDNASWFAAADAASSLKVPIGQPTHNEDSAKEEKKPALQTEQAKAAAAE